MRYKFQKPRGLISIKNVYRVCMVFENVINVANITQFTTVQIDGRLLYDLQLKWFPHALELSNLVLGDGTFSS